MDISFERARVTLILAIHIVKIIHASGGYDLIQVISSLPRLAASSRWPTTGLWLVMVSFRPFLPFPALPPPLGGRQQAYHLHFIA